MILVIFNSPPKKEEDSINMIVGSVQSTFQKVQIIHELEFLYAPFMISLRYHLCNFYTDYALTKKYPKKLCYVNTIILCLFML